MPRNLSVDVNITDPKAIFTRLLSGASANAFIAVNAGIQGAGEGEVLTLNDGANIKNLGVNNMLVKTEDVSHGAATGFLLTEDSELFIEIGNLSEIFVKNNVSGQGISYAVYAN
jgi:hypothetical protein